MRGWWSNQVHPSGKRAITFRRKEALARRAHKPINIPCGQCIGCRLERSRQWAIRCVHEAQLHEHNVFITLTYRDEDLPRDRGLVKEHWQLFMKRLRKRRSGVRYLHCGEYGEEYGRPHYHAVMFNCRFGDQKFWKKNDQGDDMYTSQELEELWQLGFCSLGAVTFKSAAYVARYVCKKTSPGTFQNIWIDPETGEVHPRPSEYGTQSRRPGLGTHWVKKYGRQTYQQDFVVVNGMKMRPPKFYDTTYELLSPKELEAVKLKRWHQAERSDVREAHLDRLRVKQEVLEARTSQLKRSLE